MSLDDVYDDLTLARIERDTPSHDRPALRGWRRGTATGVIVTGLVVGMREAVEPERRDEIVEEVDLFGVVDPAAPVVYVHVPGAPAASRAYVRPWLLPALRSSRR
jgi:hypothetical protein